MRARSGVATLGQVRGDVWPDEESRLVDLLIVVKRTMWTDTDPARAKSWRRLRKALQEALSAS